MKNSFFTQVSGGVLNMLRSSGSVTNCSFVKLVCQGLDSLLAAANSSVIFQNVIIEDFRGQGRGSLMDLEQDTSFTGAQLLISNVTSCLIACITLSNTAFLLVDSQVKTLPSNFISATDASIVLQRVLVQDTVRLDKYGDGGLLLCQNCKRITVESSIFQALKGRNGGVMYIANTNPKKLLGELSNLNYILEVTNCTFKGSSAVAAGGALYLSEGNAKVVNCVLQGNSATVGGALELLCAPEVTSYRCDYFFSNTTFRDNWGRDGGAIHYNVLLPRLVDSILVNNTATFGPDLGGVPCSLHSVFPLATPFQLISGAQLNQTLTFGVYDSLNQLVTSDNEDTCRVTVQVAGVTIQGNTIAPVQGGKCLFDALTVKSDPGNEFKLIFTSTAVDYNLPEPNSNITQLPYQVPVLMINCSIGWILSGGVCQQCPRGQYSFTPSETVCSVCKTGMDCKGGAEVDIVSGYWRSGNYTDRVYKCTIEKNCLGGEGIGNCIHGNTGKMCAVCEEGWFRNGQFSCSQCSDPTQALVIGVLGGTALLVFLLLMVYTSIKYARRNAKTTSVLLRILLNFMQEIVILRNLDLKWPESVDKVFGGLKQIWAVDYTFTSYKCGYSEESNSTDSVFMSQKIVCVGPVVLVLLCFVTWGLVAVGKRSMMYLKCHLVGTYIILHSTVLIQIFTTDLSILSCLEVEGHKWLLTDMRIECWTGEHLRSVLMYTLPSLLVWCTALPLLLLMAIVRERGKNNDETLVRYSFMCKGYKRYLYFWQYLIIFKKYLILLFIFLLSPESPTLTAVAMVYCFLLYIFAQMYYKPYLTSALNLTEVSAVGFSVAVLATGLSGSNIDPRLTLVSDILMGVTFLVLAIFVGYMVIQVLSAVCTWKKKTQVETKDKKEYSSVRPSNTTLVVS